VSSGERKVSGANGTAVSKGIVGLAFRSSWLGCQFSSGPLPEAATLATTLQDARLNAPESIGHGMGGNVGQPTGNLSRTLLASSFMTMKSRPPKCSTSVLTRRGNSRDAIGIHSPHRRFHWALQLLRLLHSSGRLRVSTTRFGLAFVRHSLIPGTFLGAL
jgi:hypothetical protein